LNLSEECEVETTPALPQIVFSNEASFIIIPVNLKFGFKFAGMITRLAEQQLLQLMQEFPAVAILGPRQVGKTTLAFAIEKSLSVESIYLDLESPQTLARLSDPEAYIQLNENKLLIFDEIQRIPDLFPILRGIIDARRRNGKTHAQFLLLGSASQVLIRQSSESLAGRIAYLELPPFNLQEVGTPAPENLNRLWLRGGFPTSFLAKSEEASFRWRSNFISTYLERDIPQLGPRISTVTLRRLWTMLAHNQGTQANNAQLAAGLGVSSPTVKSYIELLEDLLLIRSLRPWFGNVGKRLVKSPKVYIRDSGLTHALLYLTTLNDVLGHPVAGNSWEGFVIENLISVLPPGATSWYYRTSDGAEIDLIIETGTQTRFAIEIKRALAPTLSKGFYLACNDIAATHRFVVYPGQEVFPIKADVMAMPLLEMMKRVGEGGA